MSAPDSPRAAVDGAPTCDMALPRNAEADALFAARHADVARVAAERNALYDEAQRKYESPRVSPEGPFWPVPRDRMVHGPTLRARMVEDLRQVADANAAEPSIHACRALLEALGWTKAQVTVHGFAFGAIDAFLAARKGC